MSKVEVAEEALTLKIWLVINGEKVGVLFALNLLADYAIRYRGS